LKFNPSKVKVFTEQGVYMLATVLKSDIATEVNIAIMRTFTKLKNLSVPYFDIIKRLETLETDNKETKELLHKVVQVVTSMQSLQNEAKEKTNPIGFRPILIKKEKQNMTKQTKLLLAGLLFGATLGANDTMTNITFEQDEDGNINPNITLPT
jgi:hypothetical protein